MARSVGIDRQQVVAAAAELADRAGLEALTLAQVAAQLGVRLPSLYNHVDGLTGLRREMALLGQRQLLERISRAAIGKAGEAALIAVGQAYRRYVLEHPGVYTASVRAPAPDDAEMQQVGQTIIEVLLAVLEPYGLDQESAIHAIRGLRSIAHGFTTLELAGGFGLVLDRDESFLRLLRAYVAGLGTKGIPDL
ncbi:MAG: TetR/AcrR family transcriptional regulator [Anaerolineales bacterium]|nr:TetR/AcrR family transcriptional regulator [Anaerolineales bacterium]